MNESEPTKFVRKVCLVGDPAVGKTSLVRRFVLDQYDDSYIMTLGAKVMKKEVSLTHDDRDFIVTLMIWDVMGQKHFKIIESVAFEHVAGALVVCDLTKKETLENVPYWIEALTNISGQIPIILLANKSDLEAAYTEEDIRGVAAKYDNTFFYTSAKTGENVEAAFAKLADFCLKGAETEAEG